ncbi:MAG TPA: pyridoxal phosphate-dependent aminotransferase [Bryobacteraceae bacterium]|nr:pyridoxal phosphate-dependent aminotransferase [Bryobacteraceae bacterium]
MVFPEFLLDEWLGQKHSGRIEFDLGSSTGPSWTLRELLALSHEDEVGRLLDTDLLYTSSAGTPELRNAIAEMEGCDPQRVLVLTGAAEALLLLFTSAAEPGANVILPRPGFPANDALAAWLGMEARHYMLRCEDGFRVDPDEIRRLADGNTKFVLVNSPHNPTGTVLTDREVETLHDFCADRGLQFVADQVYHPIYHGAGARSAARLPHATVLGDFSKALCLSGLRTGWMIEPDEKKRAEYLTARSYFTVCNTALGEKLAAFAVRNRDAIYGRTQRIAGANLALLDGFFRNAEGILRWVRPAGGMTAYPWLANGGDARPLCQRLLEAGLLVAPGDCFGMPSHLRLGFAASGETFPAAVERMTKLVVGARTSVA